ncbi:CPBP family intramembrane metalloprotease [Aerococcaceae bacterium zg-B36]|uniref:CPBP family intramembrane glutamic endopeptidase n=1 Tax=Aerococcaceae bacterium zg-252 TaxID=2796928 RepID=UPI001BD8DEF0|nr:CPBP family intramembrane metalloprotease [Aerococcaceae bacterium zg-B36]
MKEQSWGKIIAATLLGILGLFSTQIILGFPLVPLFEYNQNLGVLVFVPLVNISVILIAYLIIRYFLKDSPSAYGLKRVSFNWKWVVLVTLLPLIVTAIIAILLGGKLGAIGTNFPFVETFVGGIIYTGFLGSVTEEVIFHALIYPLFRQKLSVWWAALVTAIIFALVHLPNDNANWTITTFSQFFFSAVAIAILFAYITESSDSIWNAAWGHVIWNIMVYFINISPKWQDNFFINVIISKDVPLISGGEGGLTGSIITPLVCLLGSAAIAWRFKKQRI